MALKLAEPGFPGAETDRVSKALASRARIGPIVRISVENEKQRPGFGRFYRVITILTGQIIAIPRKTTRPAVRSFLTFTVYR